LGAHAADYAVPVAARPGRVISTRNLHCRLGHATITETMDTYGHLFPDSEDLGRGGIDAIFAVVLTEQERN
jgi:hypothetical protein